MLIVQVKDGENIERALKRYKRKFDRTKTLKQLRNRKTFLKPSIVNRAKNQKAKYIQSIKDKENI